MQETGVRSLGREDTLEKEMATHSSILAWEIPWTLLVPLPLCALSLLHTLGVILVLPLVPQFGCRALTTSYL